MKQKYIYTVVIALSIVLLWLIWLLKEKELDTRLTFAYNDKIPYGCYSAYSILENKFGKKNSFINKKVPYKDEALYEQDSSCLFIVNSYFNPIDSDLNWLSYYAAEGNTVIISTTGINHIAQKFFSCTPSQFLYPNQRQSIISNPESFTPMQVQLGMLPTATKYTYEGVGYETHFTSFDSAIALPIGKNSVATNALLFKVGNGTIIIHLAPICFTNLFLLHQNNGAYLNNLLQYIPTSTKQFIWGHYFLQQRLLQEQTEEKGLLSVLLKYKNFTWALYILIAMGMVLLVTEFKRKQQIIPVFKQPENASLQYVETVAELYYNRADHKNLADKLITHFFDVLRNKYLIKSTTPNEALANILVSKTGITTIQANSIIECIQQIQFANTIQPQQLQQLYNNLQIFYKTA